ncbi:hypothetical protein DOTSEDRAFT_29634 [Dothistroma septosporum NZE10]|uniref:Uncharacterized protein n=1 Tax=Dothistroma septosporum (strain NZE10 / CBS 128990) TaxID=675120 RepID=M2XG34_DOTSN|nr:hypothetical protein DOTSEDRAFT_29634 [Dothistroma septosporum NZE10]
MPVVKANWAAIFSRNLWKRPCVPPATIERHEITPHIGIMFRTARAETTAADIWDNVGRLIGGAKSL